MHQTKLLPASTVVSQTFLVDSSIQFVEIRSPAGLQIIILPHQNLQFGAVTSQSHQVAVPRVIYQIFQASQIPL